MHLPQTRSGWLKLGGFFAAALAAYLAFQALVPEFDLQQVVEDVSETLGDWTYVIVSVFAFLETGAFVGLLVPGETLVVVGGAVAGQGEIDVLLLIALVWVSAFLGDTASFFIGVKLGRGFILEHGERLRISRERFQQVEDYFARHGGKTILVGRFIGIVRALAPFIAGSSGMRYRAMAPFSVLGTGLWASFFTLLGYVASQNIDSIVHASEQGLRYFAVLVGLVIATIVVVRWLRVEGNRERAESWMRERRGFRQLLGAGKAVRPQARFLWERITPGGLGLELTAPLAALAVGSFVLVAYAITVADMPGATAADRTAIEIVADLRADWLTEFERRLTHLGSPATFAAISLVAVGGFLWRGHPVEAAMIGLGALIALASVGELKQLIDRPRPTDGLIDAGGQAYPSGHATYSVLYAWLAIVVVNRIRPGLPGGTALVVAGLAVTAAVGLSRVYLGVHWLSDVYGGWALGVSAFSISTAVAVSVAHIRQNQAREP